MNVLLISHCDYNLNSAIQVYSVAEELCKLGIQCIVCVPGSMSAPSCPRALPSPVLTYAHARSRSVVFADGRGPDLVHAWTPREAVRKITEQVIRTNACSYVVHLEDNEEVILENELGGVSRDELVRLAPDQLGALVPEHRSHPIRYRNFLAGAAGVTALIDRLLEFKPADKPGLVFWPGFDPQFLSLRKLPIDSGVLQRAPTGSKVLVYNGNVHQTNATEVRSLFFAVQALRRIGRNITLLWAGSRQINHDWIQEAVGSGAVIDLGFLSRTKTYSVLALGDILVQPGRSDRFNHYRFPSKLPEFFASGKPVVLPRANVGCFLQDGVQALLPPFRRCS